MIKVINFPKNTARVFLTLFAFALSGFSAHSADVSINDIRFERDQFDPEYLDAFESLSPQYIARDHDFDIAPPPVNDSEEIQRNLELLKIYEAEKRSDETVKLIIAENHPQGFLNTFWAISSEGFKRTPYAQDLVMSVLKESEFFVMREKLNFLRARPHQLDPEISVLVSPAFAAYPAGHAAQSTIVALMLSEFDPAREEAYKKLADDISLRREIAGVHFQSDTIAGVELGTAMFEVLNENEKFQLELAEAKAKIAAVENLTEAEE